jgi:hypothetical protein
MFTYQAKRVTIEEQQKTPGYLQYGKLWKDCRDIWILGCPSCGLHIRIGKDALTIDDKTTIGHNIFCPHCGAHFWVVNSVVQPL